MNMKTADLTIGELARRSGCTVPTIRYYEEIGLLPQASRKTGGHRIYGDLDLRRVLFIRRCRDFGFPIDQVRALLDLTATGDRDCNEARDLALAHLDTVREKQRELQALERNLVSFVDRCTAKCAGGPATECVILEDLASPTPSKCCG